MITHSVSLAAPPSRPFFQICENVAPKVQDDVDSDSRLVLNIPQIIIFKIYRYTYHIVFMIVPVPGHVWCQVSE